MIIRYSNEEMTENNNTHMKFGMPSVNTIIDGTLPVGSVSWKRLIPSRIPCHRLVESSGAMLSMFILALALLGLSMKVSGWRTYGIFLIRDPTLEGEIIKGTKVPHPCIGRKRDYSKPVVLA